MKGCSASSSTRSAGKNRLFAHRSWTGLGVYEATFAPTEGGHVIESAIVTGNETEFRRKSDKAESLTL